MNWCSQRMWGREWGKSKREGEKEGERDRRLEMWGREKEGECVGKRNT